MTVTLVDYAKQSKDPLRKGFILDLLRYSDLLNVVPFETVDGLQVSGTRWQTLPSAAFRRIGAGYTESTGTTEEVVETLVALGGDVKIDNFLTGNGNMIEDPLTTQMRMKAKAVAFKFNDAFINGDQAVDPDSFEGLKKRNSNMPSRMTIDLANAGDSLKVLAGATQEHQFVDAIHQAVKYVDGATHILCNETVWLGLGQVARRLNLFQVIQDALGRTWNSISSGSAIVPFVDVGLKSDKSSEIITNTEDPGDGGNDSTSLYVVRMDTDDGLHGINLSGHELDVYDPLTGGEMESGPQKLRRIDWGVGLFNLSNYVVCRIKGFKMAAS
jgi:hypothetical protein